MKLVTLDRLSCSLVDTHFATLRIKVWLLVNQTFPSSKPYQVRVNYESYELVTADQKYSEILRSGGNPNVMFN